MTDEEEEDPKVKYWKMKFEVIMEDYQKTKLRSEKLEDRLLEIVEDAEKRENLDRDKICMLKKELEDSRNRIEQLEAACFYYKNLKKSKNGADENWICAETSGTEKLEESEDELPLQPAAIGVTRSSEFTSDEHKVCEYHKLPILAKGEGFIYGFRWSSSNLIHIV